MQVMARTALVMIALMSAILFAVPARANTPGCDALYLKAANAKDATARRAAYALFLSKCQGDTREARAKAAMTPIEKPVLRLVEPDAPRTRPEPAPPRSARNPTGLLYRNMVAMPGEKWDLWACGLTRSYNYRKVNDAYFGIGSTERESRRPNTFHLLIRAPWGKQPPRSTRFTAVLLRSGKVVATYPTTTTHHEGWPEYWVDFEWEVSRDELARLSGEQVDQAQISFNGQMLITLRDVSMKSTAILLGDGCRLASETVGYTGKPVD